MSTRAHTVPRFYLAGFVTANLDPRTDPFGWIGSLTTGEVKRKSPKKIGIARGLYDGVGGLAEPDASIEAHLAKIESAASTAIRSFTTSGSREGATVPLEVWRFLVWQAARTPGWMALEERWVRDWHPDEVPEVIEPPPEGFERIGERVRPMCLEDPATGTRIEVADPEEFEAYIRRGWKWLLRREDHLEMLHLQAWYLQVRHFPRFRWVRLDAPEHEWFITSDRGVSWIADGYVDAPPAALRHPRAEVVAPLTRKVALVGRHVTQRLEVTPREVNRFVACAASEWIFGPTKDVIEKALADRRSALR